MAATCRRWSKPSERQPTDPRLRVRSLQQLSRRPYPLFGRAMRLSVPPLPTAAEAAVANSAAGASSVARIALNSSSDLPARVGFPVKRENS
jgi:hypothetical protein